MWPTLALVVGALDVLAAVWLVVRVPRMVGPVPPATSADAAGPGVRRADDDRDERADWDALSRGDDPS